LTALEVAGGLAVIMAWENRDWIEDAVGGWFSGGRPSRNFYAESKPPLQNAVNTTQSIAYPNYGGFSLVPNSTSLGTIAEIPINKRFDYFWNRGKTRVAQSRYPNYQDGETYYDAQELIGGIWDMAYGVSYYGTSGLSDDDNTSYSVMPDYVAGPGGAPKLVGQSSRIIYSAERNIQKFFTKAGHGEAFGLKGNWNPGRIVEARDAIGKHINDPNTKTINGRFLGQNVIHYLNPNNGLNIMSTLGGDFIQGYKLGEEQLRSLLLTGRLY
jgi:hypothetical protein